MSSGLVKRLLRASTELNDPAAERPQKRRRKQERNTAAPQAPLATKEEILASQVRQMLAVDRAKSDTTSQKVVAKRLERKLKEEESIKKVASRAIVTNSRSAALQATKQHEKTFNRQTYKKEKEKKHLERLAQKLKVLTKKKK